MGDLPLSTERLLVRRFTAADVPAFAAYRSDPEVARYQSWDTPVENAEQLVADFAAAHESEPGWFQYAVELRADHILIGDVGVRLDDNRMQADVGFTLAREHQGQGYATEAVQAVLDRLFATGLQRVSAECDTRNAASAHLLERLGFRWEGHRRRHTWLKGEWTDDALFGLLADERRHPEPTAIFACRPNLLVDDLAAALAFYAGSLGFRIGWRWSDPRARFLSEAEPTEPGTALVAHGPVQLMLTQVPGAHTTRLHFDVRTAGQVDELFRAWTANGADIAEPPFVRAWGMYEMRLLDPDGNVLRVSSPA
ncbi:GNAT family N-acetyltransferase [Amycolatopsis sp. OK19-0408]|uniref:GNAT family N-acetyltransferase n=1 Tax=Amycolatopsis iheyensis TaxID=2945988 RepID=A0A9X2NJC3_9PSEU|nr:GNAT family N-acetyltransferase [Amycolatopsis iheyensis]MCR6487487.1 GNAT family N-acetyltransferase [Amycolatopsis iheyensis]